MQFKTYLLATMAALCQAMPNPSPEASALEKLQARQSTCTPNGAVVFYPQPNFGGSAQALDIYAFQGQKAFCQQFQPIVKGGFSFRSYINADIVVALYKTADCSGDPGYIVSTSNANTRDTTQSGYLSFQAVYAKQT